MAEGDGAGRPTKYKEQYAEQVYKLCLLGATDVEIADFFEVAESTVNLWKLDHTEFSESIKRGKKIADSEVASKLYTRAVGFHYDEVTFEKLDNKVSLEITSAGDLKEDDSYKKKVVTKMVAPDVTAQIFWLKNRQRDKWQDKTQQEHSGEVKGSGTVITNNIYTDAPPLAGSEEEVDA